MFGIARNLLFVILVVNILFYFISLQQMERILKKASKTHKHRVEVSSESRCVKTPFYIY